MASAVVYLGVLGFLVATALAVPKHCYMCADPLTCVEPTKDNLNDATKIAKQECTGDYFNIGDIINGIGGGGMTISSKAIEQNITRAFLEAAKKELSVSPKAEDPANPLGEASCVVVKFTHPAAKDVTIAFRGCAPKTVYDKGICTILNHAVGVAAGDSEDCYSCSGELCNSGFRIFSRTSVFVALVSALAFKLLF